MKVIAPTTSEVLWNDLKRILMTNPLMMGDYWSQLFLTMKSFLSLFGDEENIARLDMMIKDVEKMMSDRYNPMTLQEAEVLMFQNMDLKSGFEVNGVMVSQQEILLRLNEIKSWIQELWLMYTNEIRFTVQPKVQ